MKKNLGLVLATLLLLMVLVSCGSKPSPFAGMSFKDEHSENYTWTFTDTKITEKYYDNILVIYKYSVNTNAKIITLIPYKLSVSPVGSKEEDLLTVAEFEKWAEESGFLSTPEFKQAWKEQKAGERVSYTFEEDKLTIKYTDGTEDVFIKF